MFTKNTFCSLTFASIQVNPSGNFKVCCFSGSHGNNGMATEDDGTMMNIMTHSFKDAMNSKLHKQMRIMQANDMRHPSCEVCWARDDAENHSHRSARNGVHDRMGSVVLDDAASLMQPDGTINNIPVALDIRFGNLCNAKCIMCEPQYSNLWYEDHVVLNQTDKFRVGHKEYSIRKENGVFKSDMTDFKWWETDRWWQQFDSIKDTLKEIYVTGGEPFIVPAHGEMLDRLISAGLAGNIELWYDTNLSVINTKIISRLKHFKRVFISVSIEDLDERFELIRFPLKFDRVISNLKQLTKEGIRPTEISTCLGIYTAYAPLRLIPYFGDLGYDKFRIRYLRAPKCYDLKYLPKEEKLKILSAYDNTNIGDANKRLVVGYLNNTLEIYDEQMMIEYVRRMNTLDKLRGTDWKSVFPEVVGMMKGFV